MITNKIFCDFFIWTPKGNKTIRIYRDVQFWEKLEKKLTAFYVDHVLPEVLSNKLKQGIESIVDHESDKENVYCICQGTSKGRMIACDNIRCKYQWFHYKCVDIKRAPRGSWYCPICKDMNTV